jgi:hypothetical protein
MRETRHLRKVVIADEQEDGCAAARQTADARCEQALQRGIGMLVVEGVAGEQHGIDALCFGDRAELVEPVTDVDDALVEPGCGVDATAGLHTEVQIGEMQEPQRFVRHLVTLGGGADS